MGIVECILLIIILGISVAAMLTTMGWGSRSFTFAKEDLDNRVFLFNWFQTFESFYPGIASNFIDACAQTTAYVGGSWDAISAVAPARGDVIFKGLRFEVRETSNGGGVLVMSVKVYPSQNTKSEFAFDRRFNGFSSETVSDDVI
jgi:hypothetical protein